SRMAHVASDLYGTNLLHFLDEMGGAKGYKVDHDNDAVRPALVLENGESRWPPPPMKKAEPAKPAEAKPAEAKPAEPTTPEPKAAEPKPAEPEAEAAAPAANPEAAAPDSVKPAAEKTPAATAEHGATPHHGTKAPPRGRDVFKESAKRVRSLSQGLDQFPPGTIQLSPPSSDTP
ncbi:MAG TPA: hypothetical protein VHU40_17305, partial [Polyangia bacterium]|nr:hypothetical protein [Polyangia bacterium]